MHVILSLLDSVGIKYSLVIIAAMDSTLQSCSYRTKRKKILSSVCEILDQLKNEENCSTQSLALRSCPSAVKDSAIIHNDAQVHSVVSDVVDNHVLDNIACQPLTSSSNIVEHTGSDHDCTVDLYDNQPMMDYDQYEFDLDLAEWQVRSVCDGISDNDDNCSDASVGPISLRDTLADWAVTHNESHAALSDLLSLLQPVIPDLPRDPRTLLRTERAVATKSVAGGEYYYFGLQYWLSKLFMRFQPELPVDGKELHIYINIDGIPLFNSNSTSLWPILGYVKELSQAGPFPIAVFCSEKSPLHWMIIYLTLF